MQGRRKTSSSCQAGGIAVWRVCELARLSVCVCARVRARVGELGELSSFLRVRTAEKRVIVNAHSPKAATFLTGAKIEFYLILVETLN